jgi:hypothetical protein
MNGYSGWAVVSKAIHMLQSSEGESSEFDGSDVVCRLWMTKLQAAACPSEAQRWLGMTFAEEFRAICPTFDKSDKTDSMSLTMNLDGSQDALNAYVVSNTARYASLRCDIPHSHLR